MMTESLPSSSSSTVGTTPTYLSLASSVNNGLVSTVTDNVNPGGSSKLAPFNPTSDEAIAIVIELARLKPGQIFVDVGCGDGRILFEIARVYYSTLLDGAVLLSSSSSSLIQCLGIEYCLPLVERARQRLQQETNPFIKQSIHIYHQDVLSIFTPTDTSSSPCSTVINSSFPLAKVNVYFVYLVPTGLVQIIPYLEQCLLRGGKIISNIFSIKGWEEKGYLKSKRTAKGGLAVYLYELPSNDSQ